MTFFSEMAHGALSRAHMLSTEDLAHLKRIVALLDSPNLILSDGSVKAPELAEHLHRKAGWISDMRKRRSRVLPPTMLGEPAWDIMMELYAAHGRQRMTLTRLASATGAAQSTLIRWLRTLVSLDLVSSVPSTTDARVSILDLSGKGLASMTLFLREMPPLPN